MMIDLYCERTASGLMNEPLNTLSNIMFLVAALIAWRAVQARGGRDTLETVLITLAASIGIGSTLFHMFANHATELADVIPIWSFVALYIATVIYRMTGQNKARTARIVAIAAVITGTVFYFTSGDVSTDHTHAHTAFNGSLQYAPALAALVFFSLLTVAKKHPSRGYIVGATAMFIAALGFRTVDLDMCGAREIGTHFLWHIFNGGMVALLLLALIRTLPPLGYAPLAR
ncbi:ceramidase domain-containing protein [Nereida sp. MMG025]|uniref:ceramidase domain-containing protein n=1 Tax=Nereida sp. MMG025 TaxID=2909981 RepID=UPI001F42139D|nr:ceramidase domain-containing protein [Nereida sp. MMG025]MCF6444879.1 ceramidase [Nereida sp. MMG025]